MDNAKFLHIKSTDENIEETLNRWGRIFKVFDKQDSGCVSYGVEVEGNRWFVKHSFEEEAKKALEQAIEFYRNIKCDDIPKLINSFTTANGLALVFQWLPGEILYSPEMRADHAANNPLSPQYRFVNLPVERIIDSLNVVYKVHEYIENQGYVAVDFYDGCMMYDFEKHNTYLVDFDHYNNGPFILEKNRLPGSKRFMAPEEFIKGSLIDSRTNVYTMGAAAFVWLGGTLDRSLHKWKASKKLYEVALKAVSIERKDRYSTVKEFRSAWLQACK